MNIIRQAYDAKVFKVTVLSSFSTLFNSLKELDNGSLVLTDKGAYGRPSTIPAAH